MKEPGSRDKGQESKRTRSNPKLRTLRTSGAPHRQTGTVKFFNTSKGFGFITPESGSKDVFVHVSAVEAAGISRLTEGMKVSFEVEPHAVGEPRAMRMSLAERVGQSKLALHEEVTQLEFSVETMISTADEAQLEFSVETMISAADEAIVNIDRAVKRINQRREEKAKIKTENIGRR